MSLAETTRRLLVALTLLALWAGATWFKAARVLHAPDFSQRDDTAMFWGNDAWRYRYAKMLAANIALPEQDTAAQWPRGVGLRTMDSWLPEKLAAFAWREWAAPATGAAFHVFLIWWLSALSTLAIWPIYALSKHLWHRRRAGVASALLWATAFAGLHAANWPSIAMEDVALPWLLLALYLTLKAVRSERIAWAFLAAGCGWWALALWPGAMWFFFLVMVIAAAIDYYQLTIDLLTERVPGATPRTIHGRALYVPAALLGLAMVGAGMTVPALHGRGVAWSLPVIFGGAWVLLGGLMRLVRLPQSWRLVDDAARLMPQAFRLRRRLAPLALWSASFGFLVLLAVLTRWLTHSKLADYPVLTELIGAKLRFFGQLPLVPHLLNDDVRMLWSNILPSPAASTLWLSALGLWLLTPLASALPFIQARHVVGAAAISTGARVAMPLERSLVVGLAVTGSFLWLMVARLDGWFAWASAVLAGSLVDVAMNVGRYPPLWRLGARPKIAAAALLTLAVAANAFGLWRFTGESDQPSRTQLLALVKQIRAHTEPDAPLAASPELSATLATDTGRPVLVHPDMLNAANRSRLREFGNAMFAGEDELAAFCERLGARYLVVEASALLDTRPGAWRYDSNHPMIAPTCAAYRLHFDPQSLKKFRLIYTGPLYRLYRVGEPWQAGGPDAALAMQYYPTWNRANYSVDRLQLLTGK